MEFNAKETNEAFSLYGNTPNPHLMTLESFLQHPSPKKLCRRGLKRKKQKEWHQEVQEKKSNEVLKKTIDLPVNTKTSHPRLESGFLKLENVALDSSDCLLNEWIIL